MRRSMIRQVDEAAADRDVCQIGDPETIRAIDLAVPGAIREDRLVMTAVGRGDEAASAQRMHGVLGRRSWRYRPGYASA